MSRGRTPVTGNPDEERTVYLTFDDGPSFNTGRILDILNRYDIPATFFVIGSDSDLALRMYQRIVNEGHTLGNHTYSHDYNLIYQSPDAFMADVVKLQEFLEEATGYRPEIFRFPAGSNNRIHRQIQQDNPYLMVEIMIALRDKGLSYFDWNVSSTDAADTTLATEIIIENTLANLTGHRNAIILMHDSGSKTTTVEALPVIIETMKSRGYTFKTLSPESFYVHYHHLGL